MGNASSNTRNALLGELITQLYRLHTKSQVQLVFYFVFLGKTINP